MRTPLQVSYWRACGGRPFNWQRSMPPGFSTRCASRKVSEHHVAAGDVLEDGVRIDEIETAVGKELETGARAVVRMRVGRVAQAFGRQPDHFIGNVHAVDLAEMAAHGAHQTARPATDFERRVAARQARQLRFQVAQDVGRGSEKLFVVLFAAAEGDVVIGVFAGASVPIGAHLRQGLGSPSRGCLTCAKSSR